MNWVEKWISSRIYFAKVLALMEVLQGRQCSSFSYMSGSLLLNIGLAAHCTRCP